MKILVSLLTVALLATAIAPVALEAQSDGIEMLEKHLRNVKQLTFGGENVVAHAAVRWCLKARSLFEKR